MASRERQQKIEVIAHRGGAGLFPENTLTAFREAEDLGVDAIECDVQATSDGILAVIHDSDLRRVASVDGEVSDFRFKELSKIPILGGEHISDLDAVMSGTRIKIVIELKSPETGKLLADFFDACPEYVGRSVVISFFHEVLKDLKVHNPDITTGALLPDFPPEPGSFADNLGCSLLCFYFKDLTREYVQLCHMNGIKVNAWTPNTVDELKKVISSGADSITTDRPDILMELLGRKTPKAVH